MQERSPAGLHKDALEERVDHAHAVCALQDGLNDAGGQRAAVPVLKLMPAQLSLSFMSVAGLGHCRMQASFRVQAASMLMCRCSCLCRQSQTDNQLRLFPAAQVPILQYQSECSASDGAPEGATVCMPAES